MCVKTKMNFVGRANAMHAWSVRYENLQNPWNKDPRTMQIHMHSSYFGAKSPK